MDPFKVLGMAPIPVKGPRDLDVVRRRAKRLWKRYIAEKKKFDAVKVMEAFKMIEQNLKSKPGEGAYKILGRSRKERELDKHFNHQSKEIKKNKELKRKLRHARKGERRLHLPGDKERIPRYHRKRRRRKVVKKVNVDAIQGLNRVASVLNHKAKFARGISLIHRWMKDYMNLDNREYIFKVLHDIANIEFITADPDGRQDVVQVFEYALAYFKSWFESGESHRVLGLQWQVATVHACRCFTDDAFTLGTTITQLREVFGTIERMHQEAAAAAQIKASQEALKAEAAAKKEALKEAGDVKEEDMAEPVGLVPEASPEEGASPRSPSSFSEAAASSDSEEEEEGAVYDAEEGGEDVKAEKVEGGGRNGVCAKEELIDLDSDIEGSVKDEAGSDSASQAGQSDCSVEEVEDSIFPLPTVAQSLERLKAHFVDRCLATLFQNRTPLWAKPKIDPFFQDIFYRRVVLTQEQQTKVEAWQSRIKTLQKAGERIVGEANNPLEAHRPVVDSREERVVFDQDSNVWAAKQTFDSRDRNGARNVIR